MTFVPCAGAPDARALIPSLLPWVHAAGNPYYDWLFGSEAKSREVLETWMARSTSEVAVTGITALCVDGDPAGGYVAWPAAEVGGRRWADAKALLKAFSGSERDALRRRLADTADLFAPPEPGTYYLSKVGVLEPHRRRGHGRRLVERYLAEGTGLGYEAFSLDVAAQNTDAVRLYSGLGFVQAARRTTSDGRLTYLRFLMGRHG